MYKDCAKVGSIAKSLIAGFFLLYQKKLSPLPEFRYFGGRGNFWWYIMT